MEPGMEEVMEADHLTTHYNSDESDFTHKYQKQRRTYYNRFPEFWGTIPGEKIQEYAIYGALEISHEHAAALRTAASRLYQLLTRLATTIQQADDQSLLDIGIPLAALPYAHIGIPEMPAVMCGRLEFVMTAEGPKLLEFNAETPTFVVELFQMNHQVCHDLGLVDPNVGCQEQLVQAIHSSINAATRWLEPHQKKPASVVFSAYANNKEERNTIEFYRNLLAANGNLPYRTSFHSLDELRVTRDCLLTTEGERIDVLCKLYPTEYLLEDEAADGTPVGLALMELVRKRRLAVINPPTAFVLQNKALMALLWAMSLLQSKLFTLEEHHWIKQYILPTYFTANDTQGQSLFAGQYVVKPVYGREGNSVTIRSSHGGVIEQSEENRYNNQVMIYQQYAPLPTTIIQTENGLTEVNLVHNCFIVDGKPSAIGVRAARKLIFDDNSYFLPICHPQKQVNPATDTAK